MQSNQNQLNSRQKGHNQVDKETNAPCQGFEKGEEAVQGAISTATGHDGVDDGNRSRYGRKSRSRSRSGRSRWKKIKAKA